MTFTQCYVTLNLPYVVPIGIEIQTGEDMVEVTDESAEPIQF
jgi:hypothetical protein